jgi:hypothetical protein
MRSFSLNAGVLLLVAACTQPALDPTVRATTGTTRARPARLRPFGSLTALHTWAATQPRSSWEVCNSQDDNCDGAVDAVGPQGAGPAGRVGGEDEITNNQVQGIDEGDIVKAHGDHLVVLRRGRLFSVRVGDDMRAPSSRVDAFGPGRTPGSWYDEMLIDGDTLVVIGFNGAAGASEVGLFDIDAQGIIRWRETLLLRSGDYYSSRNYASRLVGGRLVMYLPVPLSLDHVASSLPALRRTPDGPWEPLVDAATLYAPLSPVRSEPVVHTVMSCDVGRGRFGCRAVGAVGPAGRNFYVSSSAVYLWLEGEASPSGVAASLGPPPSTVLRLPLDCGAPGAVIAQGAPLDAHAFDESGGELRVAVLGEGSGEGMWAAQEHAGNVALLRVPLAEFTDAAPTVGAAAYRSLPGALTRAQTMQNRFVGDHLLYGFDDGAPGAPVESPHLVWVYDLARDRAASVALSHIVTRIERLGRDAVVVGPAFGGLAFSAVSLGATPTLASQHLAVGATEGDARSHGFFYRAEGDQRGVIGLATMGERTNEHRVTFVRVSGLQLRALGHLTDVPPLAGVFLI